MMHPRTRSSSSPRATRNTTSPRAIRTPLRKENSYDSTRSVNTSPQIHSVEELSPFNINRGVSDTSPSYDKYRQYARHADHIGLIDFEPSLRNDSKDSAREERLRSLRQDAMNDFLPGTASFIGEKLMVTTGSMNDIYYLALSYYQQQEYGRALDILNTKETINKSVRCRYLAALCSLALENPRDALDYLGHENPFSGKKGHRSQTLDTMNTDDEATEGTVKLEACLCFARGKAYLVLKEIDNAKDCFKEALMVDVKCYDALEALVKYNMMDEASEWQFVMTLPYEEHCGQDADFYRYLYGLKLKRDILNGQRMDSDMENLSKSLDVKLSKAEGYFKEYRYEECLKICKDIKAQDSFFKESIPLYLACLYELERKNELYEYAQELVSQIKDEAIAWHAVGLYYLFIKKNLDARRFFSQALMSNQFFQESWLGYGHSFSAEKDHDQAINAYMTCSRLIPGSYLPLMNIAMQFMEQNKLDAAYDYFMLSLEKNKTDPFLHNELAVYYYKVEQYQKARDHLHVALQKARKHQYASSVIWGKVWCNLGHVYRHPPLRNDDRALKCFENALLRNPNNWDARASIGMIYQLKGNTARAIEEYQIALTDTEAGGLVNELLEMAIASHRKEFFDRDTQKEDSFASLFASFREMKNEVDIELDEEFWKSKQEANVEPIMTDTVDDIIIDEGDLSRRDMSN